MSHTFRGAFLRGLLAFALGCSVPTVVFARSISVTPWHVILFSDGTRFVAYDGTRTLTIFSTADGSVVRQFTAPELALNVALSPDEKRLLTVCSDGSLVLWDVENGERVWQKDPATTWLRRVVDERSGASVSFAGNGERFAYPTGDGAIVFDARTGDRIIRLNQPGPATREAAAVALGPDGERGFLITADGHLHGFDVATGRVGDTGIVADGWQRYCCDSIWTKTPGGWLCYSADGRSVAFPSNSGAFHDQLSVVQLGDKLTRRDFGRFGKISYLRAAADGTFLVTAKSNVFPNEPGAHIGIRIRPAEGRIEELWRSTPENDWGERTAYSPQLMIGVTPGSNRGIAKVRDLHTGNVVLTIGEDGNETIKSEKNENERAATTSTRFLLWCALGLFVLGVVVVAWRGRVRQRRTNRNRPMHNRQVIP